MKAILFDAPGDASVLHIGDADRPDLRAGEVRIRVAAAGVNRADILQRRGAYPPPPGATDILGLECSGTIIEIADDVLHWNNGDMVMALLPGGGYAEEVVVHHGSVMRVPGSLSLFEAAAFPETFLTAFLNVFQLGGLPDGGALLVHGGGSGIGTAATKLAKAVGATVIVTAGSDWKCQRCMDLGADSAVNYRRDDFLTQVKRVTDNRGVDVVLDHIGGTYFEKNLESLAANGRMVVIGLMGGTSATIDLKRLLARGLSVTGSTLRRKSASAKQSIVSEFINRFGVPLAGGRLRPVVDQVFPMERAAEAHRRMEASDHFGKIVLEIAPS
ncbi:MAG: NAD(P)H-quinone oxidoreductase [Pirellulaceae bacterium]